MTPSRTRALPPSEPGHQRGLQWRPGWPWTGPAWVMQSGWLVLLMALWEGLARTGWYPPLLFPRMTEVLRSLAGELYGGELVARAAWSLATISLGVVLAVGAALVATLVSLSCRPCQYLVQSLLNVLHPLPGIAVLPIFLLWFGTGSRAITAVVAFSCLWPLLGNLLAGLAAIPPTQLEAARNLGLSGVRLVLAVMIPASLPYAIAGLRLSWARGWQTAVAAEMVFGAGGGDGGLGWFIYKRRFFLEIPAVFAGMLTIIAIGMLVEHGLFETLERRTTRRWGMTQLEGK